MTTLYAVACPPWCAGGHTRLLVLDADPGIPDAEESVFHERVLAVTHDHAVEVALIQEDVHPDSALKATPQCLQLYAGGGDPVTVADPGTLREWAAVLTNAAELAERVTTW